MSMTMTNVNSTVFVVDDDESVRDSVKSLLKSMGFHAEVFGSTEEFMKIARPDAPSCLVLDIRLPGVNGLDFQDDLEKAGIEIPIIFITAHGDIPMTLRALKGGAVEFLAKPFQKEELVTAIHQALDRDRTRRAEQEEFSVLRARLDKLTSREREVTFDMALLNKMATRLSVADPLQEVLSEVVEFVSNVVKCDSCMVYVLEGEDLVLRASKNPHPEVLNRLKTRVGQGMTGWVAENKQPVVTAQAGNTDPRL